MRFTQSKIWDDQSVVACRVERYRPFKSVHTVAHRLMFLFCSSAPVQPLIFSCLPGYYPFWLYAFITIYLHLLYVWFGLATTILCVILPCHCHASFKSFLLYHWLSSSKSPATNSFFLESTKPDTLLSVNRFPEEYVLQKTDILDLLTALLVGDVVGGVQAWEKLWSTPRLGR